MLDLLSSYHMAGIWKKHTMSLILRLSPYSNEKLLGLHKTGVHVKKNDLFLSPCALRL